MTALPTGIVAGDTGHISHHNTIHALLNPVDAPFALAGGVADVLANLPAAGVAGREYWDKTRKRLLFDDGAVWRNAATDRIFNVEDPIYGAVGDGTTDDGPAIEAAIDDAIAAGGGCIWFPNPAGVYKYATQITKSGSVKGLIFAGPGITTPGLGGPELRYTGTGATLGLLFESCYGVKFKGLKLTYNAAGLTGALIGFENSGAATADSAHVVFEECSILGVGGAVGSGFLVYLNHTILVSFVRCVFDDAVGAVGSGPDYANVVQFDRCDFGSGLSGYPVVITSGESWLLGGCSSDRPGKTAAFVDVVPAGGSSIYNVTAIGCWAGDSTGAGDWFRVKSCLGFTSIGFRCGTGAKAVSFVTTRSQDIFIAGTRSDASQDIDLGSLSHVNCVVLANDVDVTNVATGGGGYLIFANGASVNYMLGQVNFNKSPVFTSDGVTGSINLPHFAGPTTPENGDVWTTTLGLFVRINGVTKTVTLT